MATESVFSKIVAGEIPCWKLHEDEHTFAFLDINPLARGHALIIPKVCYPTLDQVPDNVAEALGRAVKRVGSAVAQAVGTPGWNVLQNNGAEAGQEVFHVHFHVIPRVAGDGLGYRWKPGPLDQDTARDLADSIVSRLS